MAAALVAAGHVSHAASGSDWIWQLLVAFAMGFISGVGLGRKRGLKHLSEVHFKTNWAAVRNRKRF